MIGQLKQKFDENPSLINLVVFAISWGVWTPVSIATRTYRQVYLLQLGATPVIVSLILSVSSFSVAFARIPGGYLTDRYGRKKMIVPLTFLVGICALIFAFAPTWQVFLIGVIINQAAHLYQPAIRSILADSLPEEQRGRGYSFLRILPNLAAIAGPSLALFLVSHSKSLMRGVRLTYFLSFFAGIGIAILRWKWLRPTVGGQIKKEEFIEDMKHQYGKAKDFILQHLKPLMALYLLYRIGHGMMVLTQIYVIFLASTEYWGVLSILRRVTVFGLTIPFGYLTDRKGRRKPLLIGLIALAGSAFILWSTTATTVRIYAIISIILLGISRAVRSTALRSLEADLVPKQLRGRVAGVLSFISGVAFATGQLIAGPIYNYEPALPFLIASILVTFSIICVVKIDNTSKKEDNVYESCSCEPEQQISKD